MRIFIYKADPLATYPVPWGGRYPSRIGFWMRLPRRRILALQRRLRR